MSDNFQVDAEAILEALGEELGIEGLTFSDESNTCLFQIDKARLIALTGRAEEEDFVIHTQVGLLPQENRCDIVEELMEANLFWAGTRGGTLSIERERGVVIVAQALSRYESNGELLTGKTLGAAILDLVDVANHWAALLGGRSEVRVAQETQEEDVTNMA
ncbi:MAG: type III secretion system chaperone [Verrucomicrobiae bacterium]|nr:type III secretion system chaperone [Verrucomicrobiae bacterium]